MKEMYCMSIRGRPQITRNDRNTFYFNPPKKCRKEWKKERSVGNNINGEGSDRPKRPRAVWSLTVLQHDTAHGKSRSCGGPQARRVWAYGPQVCSRKIQGIPYNRRRNATLRSWRRDWKTCLLPFQPKAVMTGMQPSRWSQGKLLYTQFNLRG